MTPVSLSKLHEQLAVQTRYRSCVAATSIFVITAALSVITCSCLCLMLPGVNAVTQIICPAILPSIAAIVIALPFLLRVMGKNQLRQELLTAVHQPLVDSAPNKTEKELKQQALDLLPKSGSSIYNAQVLTDVKKKLPQKEADRSKDEQKLFKALEATIKAIHKGTSTK